MGRRVDARDVLDPDAATRKAFRARIIGHYRKTGPDPWDDYEHVYEEEGVLDVHPGLPVQLERHGVEFRLRSQGRVVHLRWVPPEGEAAALPGTPGLAALRRRFLEEYIVEDREPEGHGVAAFVAKKLADE